MNPRDRLPAAASVLMFLASAFLGIISARPAPLGIPEPVDFLDTDSQLAGPAWTPASGLPAGGPVTIFADSRGYVWFGFTSGLARFDGMRFKNFDRNARPELLNDHCLAVTETPAGRIWVASNGGGLWEIHNGEWRVWSGETGVGPHHLSSVCPSADGGLWVTDTSLHFISSNRVTHWNLSATFVFEDRDRRIFIARDDALFQVNPKTRDLKQIVSTSGTVSKMAQDISGRYVMRTSSAILLALRLGEPRPRVLINPDALHADVADFSIAPDDSVFAATPAGLYRVDATGPRRITIPGDALDNDVSSVCFDRAGTLWAGTRRGVRRLSAPYLKTIAPRDTLQQVISSISQAADGSVWVGTAGGLLHWTSNGTVRYGREQGLLDNFVRCVRELPAGHLWIAYGEFRLSEISASEIRHLDCAGIRNPQINGIFPGKHQEPVFTGKLGGGYMLSAGGELQSAPMPARCETIGYLETSSGERWIGSYRWGGVIAHFLRGGQCELFTRSNAIPTDVVAPVYEDAAGAVWFGTDKGIARWKKGKFSWIRVQDGLLEGIPFNLIEDDFGGVWSNGRKGIYRYSKAQLDAFCDGRISRVDGEQFGMADGMLTVEGDGPAFPSGCKIRDGTIWIPTIKGIVVIDPARRETSKSPAGPPVIEQISADSRVVYGDDLWRAQTNGSPRAVAYPETEVHFAPGAAAVLRIEYAAPGALAPEQTRMEHKLEGLDHDWVEAVEERPERAAYFTSLRPGHYTFRFRAKTAGGGSSEGTPFRFVIEPHYYETMPFYTACLGCLLFSGYGLHRRRIRTWRRIHSLEQNAALERERTRIARDMHDCLGASLAKIQLLSESAARSGAASQEKLARIVETARDTSRDVDEIIWLLKTSRHSVKAVAEFLSAYAAEFLAEAQMDYREEIPLDLPDELLSVDTCHHLFLAFKEALTNACRHSGAQSVSLRCSAVNRQFAVAIHDDGRGFEPETDQNGARKNQNGLGNMEARMRLIGGDFRLETRAAGGTTVIFRIAY